MIVKKSPSISRDCYFIMTEDDTFRILARRPFDETREALQEAWELNKILGSQMSRRQTTVDLLRNDGWTLSEYGKECNRQGYSFLYE